MTAQFQYTTLPHQTAAVQSLADVLADVRFVPPANVHANPSYVPREAAPTLKANLAAVRQRNGVRTGTVYVPDTATPALNLDVLMETGTGKTFTFIETIHRLHREHRGDEHDQHRQSGDRGHAPVATLRLALAEGVERQPEQAGEQLE